MSNISMQVSTSKLMQSLTYAFNSPRSVLGELLQNSRRAKAKNIVLTVEMTFLRPDGEPLVVTLGRDEWDAVSSDFMNAAYTSHVRRDLKNTTLTSLSFEVCDDGCGIDDFQKLFCLADSGWSDDVMEAEGPYGLGFFSAIVSAPRILLSSRGIRLDVNSAALISGNGVAITETHTEDTGKTVVRLEGIDASRMISGNLTVDSYAYSKMCYANLVEYIQKLVQAFPVPVRLPDGYRIQSPFADIPGRHGVALPCGSRAIFGRPVTGLTAFRKPEQEAEFWKRYVRYAGSMSTSVMYSLQSLPIEVSTTGMLPSHGSRSRRYYHAMVHLNSRSYRGRLPDRSHIYGEDERSADLTAIREDLYGMVAKRRIDREAPQFGDNVWADAAIRWLMPIFSGRSVVHGMVPMIEMVPSSICMGPRLGSPHRFQGSDTLAKTMDLARLLGASRQILCRDMLSSDGSCPLTTPETMVLVASFSYVVDTVFTEVYPEVPVTTVSSVVEETRAIVNRIQDRKDEAPIVIRAGLPEFVFHEDPVPAMFIIGNRAYLPKRPGITQEVAGKRLAHIHRTSSYPSAHLKEFVAAALKGMGLDEGFLLKEFRDNLNDDSEFRQLISGGAFTLTFDDKGELTYVARVR